MSAGLWIYSKFKPFELAVVLSPHGQGDTTKPMDSWLGVEP